MIKKVLVSIYQKGSQRPLGELVIDGRKIYFRYLSSYLVDGHNISPFKLRFDDSIQSADADFFDGLFGVFGDSLPDGWGRLLMDRFFRQRGRDLNAINGLDRLAFVGMSGMGALSYQPIIDYDEAKEESVDLDVIQRGAADVLQGEPTEVLESLYRMGGTSGGARPKILVGYAPGNNHLIQGANTLPVGYEPWIIKFTAAVDQADAAAVEYVYYLLAQAAGIEMSKCHLFQGASGKRYFGTKRFDRGAENQRLHLHSLAGLVHDNFRYPNLDYGHLMDAAFRLEKDIVVYKRVLKRAAFNIIFHNRDDHTKNFAFLQEEAGNWTLSPAFDLTFSQSGFGHHSMTVAGEGANPSFNDFKKLADDFGVDKPSEIWDEVREVASRWQELAREHGVSQSNIKIINDSIEKIK